MTTKTSLKITDQRFLETVLEIVLPGPRLTTGPGIVKLICRRRKHDRPEGTVQVATDTGGGNQVGAAWCCFM